MVIWYWLWHHGSFTTKKFFVGNCVINLLLAKSYDNMIDCDSHEMLIPYYLE